MRIVATHTDLGLLRVKTRVSSYNLYTTPFFSYPSHFTLVKLIKLKGTLTVCTENERERRRRRKKTSNSIFAVFQKFFSRTKKSFSRGKMNSRKIKNKNKKIYKEIPWYQGYRSGVPCWYQGSHLRFWRDVILEI